MNILNKIYYSTREQGKKLLELEYPTFNDYDEILEHLETEHQTTIVKRHIYKQKINPLSKKEVTINKIFDWLEAVDFQWRVKAVKKAYKKYNDIKILKMYYCQLLSGDDLINFDVTGEIAKIIQ